jgi:glycosyltransferase involved in cell wall biosynthesis
VLPTRAPAPFLASALASVLADADAAEVVVVDDGGGHVRDEAAGRARVVRTAGVGRSRARNLGVEATTAPLVAFLDDDDVSLPGRLARQRAALLGDPGAVLCFGPVRIVDGEGRGLEAATTLERARLERLLRRGPTAEGLLADCPLYPSAVMVRREAFLAAGGFDPALDAYEEVDLYLRLARLGRLVGIGGEPVAEHRRHAANTPSDALYRGSLLIVDKHLPGASGRARRLLLDRRVDALWGLGEFARARREAVAAARRSPLLLGRPRFAKRLLGSLLPIAVLRTIRARRT